MTFHGVGIQGRSVPRKRGKGSQVAAVVALDVEADTPRHLEAVKAAAKSPLQKYDDPPPEGNKLQNPGFTNDRNEPGEEDFHNLGELLVYLRETYFDRLSGGEPDRPRSELKAAAVVDYLRKHGYSMTSGSYSLLEQGKTLPRNPEQFLAIVSKCLHVDRTSKYWMLLRRQYVYDHTARFVGKEYADRTIIHGSQLVASMRNDLSDTDSSKRTQPD